MRAIAALILLPLLAAPALAQGTSVELTDPIPTLDGMTYLDLARTIVPDIEQVDGRYEGTVTKPVRHLAYVEEPAANLTISTYGGSAVSFVTHDGPRIALMLDAQNPEGGAWSSVLAIFDPGAPGVAIDVADVATDQMTSFAEQTLLRLGPDDEGLLIESTHFNSNQGYRDTAVVAMMDGALTQLASVFSFNENYCGMRREQTAHLASVTTDGDEQWSPFTITVTETTLPNDCDDGSEKARAGTRAVAATFSWAADAGRYEADSTALADLYDETEARF